MWRRWDVKPVLQGCWVVCPCIVFPVSLPTDLSGDSVEKSVVCSLYFFIKYFYANFMPVVIVQPDSRTFYQTHSWFLFSSRFFTHLARRRCAFTHERSDLVRAQVHFGRRNVGDDIRRAHVTHLLFKGGVMSWNLDWDHRTCSFWGVQGAGWAKQRVKATIRRKRLWLRRRSSLANNRWVIGFLLAAQTICFFYPRVKWFSLSRFHLRLSTLLPVDNKHVMAVLTLEGALQDNFYLTG